MNHYLITKNKLILLLFVMTASLADAQILKYHYDKEMTFLSEADSLSGISVRFNSKDKSVPVYSIDFDSEKRFIRNTINFYYPYRKNMYRMDGVLYNKKYVAANGFQTYSAESPVRSFKKASDTLYDYRSFKNLEKRISVDKEGPRIEIFVANLKDQIDYAEPSLFFLSQHYGISPGLNKGEMVVYANYIFNEKNSAANFVKLKDIDETVYFNKEQIEYLIDDRYNDFYRKIETDRQPVYCSVTASGKEVDEKTAEEIADFLSNMCEYFTIWRSNESNNNFRAYYDSEVRRRAAVYQKNGTLSEKQLKVYLTELNEIKNQNSAENFDYK